MILDSVPSSSSSSVPRTAWEDSEVKSQAWEHIAHGNVELVLRSIAEEPCFAKMRARDGRGPLHWAHEFHERRLIDALLAAGADAEATDATGLTPARMPRAPPITYTAPEDAEDEIDYGGDDDDDDDDDEAWSPPRHDEM